MSHELYVVRHLGLLVYLPVELMYKAECFGLLCTKNWTLHSRIKVKWKNWINIIMKCQPGRPQTRFFRLHISNASFQQGKAQMGRNYQRHWVWWKLPTHKLLSRPPIICYCHKIALHTSQNRNLQLGQYISISVYLLGHLLDSFKEIISSIRRRSPTGQSSFSKKLQADEEQLGNDRLLVMHRLWGVHEWYHLWSLL